MKQYHRPSNQSTIKTSNRSLVLNVLNTNDKISRTQLAKITGLTKTSITKIINNLIKNGIVIEADTTQTSAGRKPVNIKLRENAFFCIGVYISRDNVFTSLVNLKGKVLISAGRKISLVDNACTLMESLCEDIDKLFCFAKDRKTTVLGIGVASIGPIDVNRGIILEPPNFRGVKSICIAQELKNRYYADVCLDNDMNAAATAEKLFGRGRTTANFIYVGVTNGIGAGIVLDHSLFRGSSGFAGEIGHTTVDVKGPLCPCGNRGCLELYASIPVVVGRVASAINREMSFENIVSAAYEGNKVCLDAINTMVEYLAAGIISTVNTFDPQLIFLGHDIAAAGELVTGPLENILNNRFLSRKYKNIPVKLSSFKQNAPHMGAPAIILDRFFNGM